MVTRRPKSSHSLSPDSRRPDRAFMDARPVTTIGAILVVGKNPWAAIDALIRGLCTGSKWIASTAVVILLLLGVVDNVGSQVFGKSLPSAIELQEVFAAILIFFAIIVVQRQQAHLTVDLITNRLGRRGRRLCRAFGLLCTIALFVLISWQAYELAVRSWSARELSPGFLSFPLYPFKAAVAAACLVMTLEALRQLVRNIVGAEEMAEASFDKEDILP